jgi:hypothetical protein
MERLQRDLRRTLCWAAVNHYNTDSPHAHIVIRGLDVTGQEVRMAREYVSHGLRHRAEELATQELGPRPARARAQQLQREVVREGYTSLDRALERRAVGGVLRLTASQRLDVPLHEAFNARLNVLETLGLVERAGRREWRLSARLRPELEQMARRSEGLRAIAAVLQVNPAQCRVIDRAEPRDVLRAELERGVQGVLRWKGLDEQGQFCAVVETTRGEAYHLPISSRVAGEARVGQVVELRRAIDKDERIEAIARAQGWIYDVGAASEASQGAYRRRLEQLERLQLAQHVDHDRWRVREDFRVALAQGTRRQPYWQMLGLRADSQPLSEQVQYPGAVWLDRVRLGEVGVTGFGRDVRYAVAARHRSLRGLGLDPNDPRLRWKLRDMQAQQLERRIEASLGYRAVRAHSGFHGVARLHRERNGERFIEVRGSESFVLCPAQRYDASLDGQAVRVHVDDKKRIRLEPLDRVQERGR